MKNFVLLISFFSLSLVFSCGDKEEEEPMTLNATATVFIDGIDTEITAASGFITNSVVSNFDTRNVDVVFQLENGSTLRLGLQNLDMLTDDFCVRERTYLFEADDIDCNDIFGGTACEEADCEYENMQNQRWSDFQQEGSVTITECLSDISAISGSFSGVVANLQSETISVSGQFSNIVIIE